MASSALASGQPSPQSQPYTQPQQQSQAPPQPQQQQQQVVTTEKIQQYLDENDALINTIVENMNANKLKECSEYQARLQANLMYLAAIADQAPTPSATEQQGM